MRSYTVTLSVDVTQPKAVWLAAREYLKTKSYRTDAEIRPIIGTVRDPNIEACLTLLLEPDDKPDGIEVAGTVTECVHVSTPG